MIKQGFHIGKRDWWVMVYYEVTTAADFDEMYQTLVASGCQTRKAREACNELRGWNAGYTYTNYNSHSTVVFIGKARNAADMFDSIIHEIKHITEHIGNYYHVNPKEEMSAYLQGEVGRTIWQAAAYVLCPKCKD